MKMLLAEHPFALMIYHRSYGPDVAEEIARDVPASGDDGRERRYLPWHVQSSPLEWLFCTSDSHGRARAAGCRPRGRGQMLGFPATRFRIPNRGFIREGYAADLVIFDAETIADGATWERPLESPVGIELVMVGGVAVVDRNVPTGALPGSVLQQRHAGAASMSHPLRTVVVGLEHYHVTGWVEGLVSFRSR